MASAGTVDVEFARLGVVYRLEKARNDLVRRIAFVRYRDIDILEAGRFGEPFFVRRVVRQVDDRVDPDGLEGREILFTGPRTAIETVVHLAEIRDLDAGKI